MKSFDTLEKANTRIAALEGALRKSTLMLDSQLCLNDDHEYETECEAYTIPELRSQIDINEALLARKEQE